MYMLTCQQVRAVDQRATQKFHVPSVVLMENAGRSAAELLLRLGCRGPVLILCGAGNNAGDGLVVARHLDVAAIRVHIIAADDPARWQGDTAINYAIARASGLPLTRWQEGPAQQECDTMIAGSAWIVDALLGTGARGAPRSPMDTLIRLANRAAARRFALDIPSGLDGDTGEAADPTFRAHHTCTFVAVKVGFAQPTATPFLGQVHVVGIGAPPRSLSE
jgi:NAD(P)H-hydrate epimerase